LTEAAEHGLDGTGYQPGDLDDLMAQLARRDEQPQPPHRVEFIAGSRPPRAEEIVLMFAKEQRDQLEQWLKIVAKERGTEGVSATVYAAAEIAARFLNQGA